MLFSSWYLTAKAFDSLIYGNGMRWYLITGYKKINWNKLITNHVAYDFSLQQDWLCSQFSCTQNAWKTKVSGYVGHCSTQNTIKSLKINHRERHKQSVVSEKFITSNKISTINFLLLPARNVPISKDHHSMQTIKRPAKASL